MVGQEGGVVVTTNTTALIGTIIGNIEVAFNKVTFRNGSVVVNFDPDIQVSNSIEMEMAAREAVKEACGILEKRKDEDDRKWIPDTSKLTVLGVEPNIRFESTCVCG